MSDTHRDKALRRWVYQRDTGVCASCGCDTEFTYEVFRHALIHLRDLAGWRAFAQWRELVSMAGFIARKDSWWEADHIHPLSEGGADTLENLRTLCLPCHRQKTAQLRKRLAKFRRLYRKRPHTKYQRYQLHRLGQ